MEQHMVKTEIDKRTFLEKNKTVSLTQFSTKNGSSWFWRVNIESRGNYQSIPFDDEKLARAVFQSHLKF